MSVLWQDCLEHLKDKISPTDFGTWIRPLQADVTREGVTLYAPHQFVETWVQNHYLTQIIDLVRFLSKNEQMKVSLRVGVKPAEQVSAAPDNAAQTTPAAKKEAEKDEKAFRSNLNPALVFDNFVQGSSNQLAKVMAEKVAKKPGAPDCNPLSLYGNTGLGKTHLLHAIGNLMVSKNPQAKVFYISSENFIRDITSSIQRDTIEQRKKFYRSLDMLMLDDIQFLAKGEKSQEEFFHIFNTLIERNKQIVVASDRFPKNIEKMEERLKSRLGWGLNAAIEPPELETRVAILMKKSEEKGVPMPEDVAFFIGQKMRTNVRELEGAVNNMVAWVNFKQRPMTVDAVREALKDSIDSYDKLVTVDNIQRVVAEYYHIKVADLNSKSRKRSVTRPRQLAMALARELTNRSFPEIGDAFGGRHYSTVIHACEAVEELRQTDRDTQEDFTHLIRKLSS